MSGGSQQSRIILVSGIPCSGKTNYTHWLEREKGFTRWDVENTRQVPTAQELAKIGSRVVLDWGFHTNNLRLVDERKKEGIEIWWFDGDHEAARECFRRRAAGEWNLRGNTLLAALDDFDDQMERINREWSRIQAVVGDHILETISPGPTHTPARVIFERMFGNEQNI